MVNIRQVENCAICGCALHRGNDYAKPTTLGRSHATRHHVVAERFFERKQSAKLPKRDGMFPKCPWGCRGHVELFCYECHEELLHNPVLLPESIKGFAQLVRMRKLHEDKKPSRRGKIASRVQLFQEVIELGIEEMLARERKPL